LFDGGLTAAQVAAARATYEASVAAYRQTVLTAFQQVEDQLAAIRILAREASVQAEAVKAAEQAVQIALNEYRAGTQNFTTVVTAQATALSDEEAALTTREQRVLAAVSLIVALGGGWNETKLPPE
jgi:outer membrane protein TolC